MVTTTLRYNENSKFALTLMELIRLSNSVEIVESPYDQMFVSKIRASERSKKRIINPADIWK